MIRTRLFNMPVDDPRLNGASAVWVNPNGRTYHRQQCAAVAPDAQAHRLADVKGKQAACERCKPVE